MKLLHTKEIARYFVVVVVSANLCFAGDQLREKTKTALESITASSDAIVGIAIKNFKTGEEFSINRNELFPQASAIKIHILAEVYRQADQGKFKLSDIRPLPEHVRVGGSGVLNELGKNSVSMSIRDYAVLMIVLSDNTATNFLIDLVGMQNVNTFLRSIGTTKTKLQRAMMDVEAAKAERENIGTPAEVLKVLELMYNGRIVNRAACDDMLAIMKIEKSGPIRVGVPSTIAIANKEGEIEGIRTDVAIVFLEHAPYGICVMTKMLKNADDGPKIITEISRTIYNYFERKANSNRYGRRIPK
jgi:beta-lactamase class A